MPGEVAKRVSSPALSSDSSLSSAPEVAEFDLGNTNPALAVERVRAVEISNSKKRVRTRVVKEAYVPVKRTRRETGAKPSYREATEEEKEKEIPTEAPGGTADKREGRAKAVINDISHIAIKAKSDEEIEVASNGPTKRTKKSAKTKVETIKEEELGRDSPKKIRKRPNATVDIREEEQGLGLDTPKKARKGTKAQLEVREEEEALVETPKKVKRKRKTKEEKEAEAMPLAARTANLKVYIGAHVSSAKGLFSLRLATCTGAYLCR